MMKRPGFVYIMAGGRNGTIYIGSTSDLVKRTFDHRNGTVDRFTKEDICHRLVLV